jgi:hypothetical protein
MEPVAETQADAEKPGGGLGLGADLSLAKRLSILFINYWTIFQVVLIGLTLGVPWALFRWRVAAALALLFLVPPLLARAIRCLAPIREGRVPVGRRDFFVWWALFNLQVIFCRFPALEECLRVIPGLYGLWLRLWGARIGRLIYWGAGLKILDRPFIEIGDGVIFGAAVRLNPHVLARNKEGEMELMLARVVIGREAVIGGYSLLTAGTEIAPGECTKAFLISPPFSVWKGGARVARTDRAP